MSFKNLSLSLSFFTRAIVMWPINLCSGLQISLRQLSINCCKGAVEIFTQTILIIFWEKTPMPFKVNSNGWYLIEDNLFFISFKMSSSVSPKNFSVKWRFSLEVVLPTKCGLIIFCSLSISFVASTGKSIPIKHRLIYLITITLMLENY